jgi:hypothetical protein
MESGGQPNDLAQSYNAESGPGEQKESNHAHTPTESKSPMQTPTRITGDILLSMSEEPCCELCWIETEFNERPGSEDAWRDAGMAEHSPFGGRLNGSGSLDLPTCELWERVPRYLGVLCASRKS